MKRTAVFAIFMVLLSAWPLWAHSEDDDIYGEDAIQRYKDRMPDKPEWREQGLVIPPWPRDADLIGIDIERPDFPYRVFVDGASLSVGKDDGVVRFTAVLRSRSGVDNVSFEGIRCTRHQYRRYAYGSGGKFHEIPHSAWKWLSHSRQDIYRNVLADRYLCPVPTGDPVPQLLGKLKKGDDRYIFQGDLE